MNYLLVKKKISIFQIKKEFCNDPSGNIRRINKAKYRL